MKIPPDALIPESKLSAYLLPWRPKKDKSGFLAQAGFTQDKQQELERAIRQILEQNEAKFQREDEFGAFYEVVGDLVGPNDIMLSIITIWLADESVQGKFRFITLKPG